MFLSHSSSRNCVSSFAMLLAAVTTACVVNGESYLRSSSNAATQQQQQRDMQGLGGSLISEEMLAVIPPSCRVADDSALNVAIDCAVGAFLKCSGLLGVLDQFEDLIPSNADDITSCQSITDPFCNIATKCEPCIPQFEGLTRCIVDETEQGVIDDSILNLISGCSLSCDGSSGTNDGQETVIDIVDVEDIPAVDDEEQEQEQELEDIPGTAIGAKMFTTLVAALDAADLVDTLSSPNGPYTVFAPTDDAFTNLPAGLVSCLLNDIPTLTNILLYHVANGKVLSSQLRDDQKVPTLLAQQNVTVNISSRDDGPGSPRVQIDGSTVTTADVVTSNGVIHIINSVLVPSNIDIGAYLITCTTESEDYEYDEVVDDNGDNDHEIVAGDDDDDDDDNNNSLPGGDLIGDLFGDIFNPDGGDGDGSDAGDILGNLDDIDVESIGTAIGDAVSSFLGEDVGTIIGDAFNSFVSGLGDLFANSGDGSGWLGGMSNGGGSRKT